MKEICCIRFALKACGICKIVVQLTTVSNTIQTLFISIHSIQSIHLLTGVIRYEPLIYFKYMAALLDIEQRAQRLFDFPTWNSNFGNCSRGISDRKPKQTQ